MIERANQKRAAARTRAVTYRGQTSHPVGFDPTEFAKRIVADRKPKKTVAQRQAEMEAKFARRGKA